MKYGSDMFGFHRGPLNSDEIRHGSDRIYRPDHLPCVVISISISAIHPGFRSMFTVDIYYLSFIHPAPYSLFASDIFDFSSTVIVFLGEGVTLLMATKI